MRSPYNQKQFLKYSKTIHPIVVPHGVNVARGETFYRLPHTSIPTHVTPVSLVPPGSKILQYKKDQQAANKKTSKPHLASHFAKLKSGSRELILAVNVKTAWKKIGEALKDSGNYQLLDQDKNIHSYYILDTTATNHQVTESTPIYQVSIHSAGKGSAVKLLNQTNQLASANVSTRILSAVKRNLS